jgi:hypothetical protein
MHVTILSTNKPSVTLYDYRHLSVYRTLQNNYWGFHSYSIGQIAPH